MLSLFKAFLIGIPTRWRRWVFVNRAKLLARLMGVELHLDVHPTAIIERGATIKLTRGNPIHCTIGEGVTLEEGFHVQFFAQCGYEPELVIGPMCHFHRHVSLVVSGRLVFAGGNEIGVGSVFRSTQLIEMGYFSGGGEYVSVFDFHHGIDEDQTLVFQSVLVSMPVRLGKHVMLGSKCTVNPGAVISDMTLVMPNAVVSGVWPDPCQLLGGVPAKTIEKPEVFPILENPFLTAAVTWMGDKPGPNFKPIDEATAQVPTPTPYEKAKHGWVPLMERIRVKQEARQAKAAAASGSAAGGAAAKD